MVEAGLPLESPLAPMLFYDLWREHELLTDGCGV